MALNDVSFEVRAGGTRISMAQPEAEIGDAEDRFGTMRPTQAEFYFRSGHHRL